MGSSSESGQSWTLSQTFDNGIHMPPPQSNSVLRSHVRFGAADWGKDKIGFREMIEAMHEIIFLLLTAIQLVTSISTLRLAWAVEMASNARLVSALELISSTRNVLTVGHHLVIATGTILFAITNPWTMNARNAVFAEIFSLNTRHWSFPVTVVDCCAILKLFKALVNVSSKANLLGNKKKRKGTKILFSWTSSFVVSSAGSKFNSDPTFTWDSFVNILGGNSESLRSWMIIEFRVLWSEENFSLVNNWKIEFLSRLGNTFDEREISWRNNNTMEGREKLSFTLSMSSDLFQEKQGKHIFRIFCLLMKLMSCDNGENKRLWFMLRTR